MARPDSMSRRASPGARQYEALATNPRFKPTRAPSSSRPELHFGPPLTASTAGARAPLRRSSPQHADHLGRRLTLTGRARPAARCRRTAPARLRVRALDGAGDPVEQHGHGERPLQARWDPRPPSSRRDVRPATGLIEARESVHRPRIGPADQQDIHAMARPGLEPGTPRFSVVGSSAWQIIDQPCDEAGFWLGSGWCCIALFARFSREFRHRDASGCQKA